jgi:hypothetical protein
MIPPGLTFPLLLIFESQLHGLAPTSASKRGQVSANLIPENLSTSMRCAEFDCVYAQSTMWSGDGSHDS